MSFLRSNLAPRLRLLRTALTRRFIYADLVSAAREYGIDYLDVRGDTGPIDLACRIFGPALETAPDFARLIEPPEKFTPPGSPALFNSEPSVARFLGQLAFHRRATRVIELGCFVGWTTAHLACALAARGAGQIHALDLDPGCLDTMQANLRRHHWDSAVTPVCGRSLDAAVLRVLPAQADVIFLDTSHAYPETRDEILAYIPRLAPGGCLVMHDSVSASGVRRSLLELPAHLRIHTFATERSNGVTVLFRD